MKVGVIDTGVGNFASLVNILETLGVESIVSSKSSELSVVDCYVLPGVGHFSERMQNIRRDGLDLFLREETQKVGKPLLGICIGMQLLASRSTEATRSSRGPVEGLNLVPGLVENIRSQGCRLTVPHVGWNSVEYSETKHDLFANIPESSDFYFVHSYSFLPNDSKLVIGVTHHGIIINAVINVGSIFGVQFHPEKSSIVGRRLLANFFDIVACSKPE